MIGAAAPSRVLLPVNRVTDTRAKIPPDVHRRFWGTVWPEAVRTFHRGGVELQCTDTKGAVKFSAADRPMMEGLDKGKLNLVLTDRIPMLWDNARGLAGVTTIYERCDVSVIAMRRAHAFRVPFVDTNTVVHEMLHALLGDVLVKRPKWYQTNEREWRVDAYATRLWMLGDGAAVRRAVAAYVARAGKANYRVE